MPREISPMNPKTAADLLGSVHFRAGYLESLLGMALEDMVRARANLADTIEGRVTGHLLDVRIEMATQTLAAIGAAKPAPAAIAAE